MNRNPVYIVDVIGSVVTATDAELKTDPASYLSTSGKTLNYIYGDRDEINKQLQLLSQGNNTKNTKYPLVALVMPFSEVNAELMEVTLPRLIIATVTPQTLLFPERYEQFFKPVLYPVYYEFLEQLGRATGNGQPAIVESDPATFSFTKMDVPRVIPNEKEGLTNDYVDAIVISNLQFKIFSLLNC